MDRDSLNSLRKWLRPIQTRIANVVARAVVQLVSDGTKLQSLQIGVLDGEDIDDGERFQQYGFTSVPLPGAEAVVLFPNGDRGHPLVVAVDDRRHRPTGGDPGDVTIYNSAGCKVLLKADGDIEITPGSGGEVRIGSASASDPVALKSDLSTLKNAINSAPVAPLDGGAAFKAALVSALSAWPVSAQKVKAE